MAKVGSSALLRQQLDASMESCIPIALGQDHGRIGEFVAGLPVIAHRFVDLFRLRMCQDVEKVPPGATHLRRSTFGATCSEKWETSSDERKNQLGPDCSLWSTSSRRLCTDAADDGTRKRASPDSGRAYS